MTSRVVSNFVELTSSLASDDVVRRKREDFLCTLQVEISVGLPQEPHNGADVSLKEEGLFSFREGIGKDICWLLSEGQRVLSSLVQKKIHLFRTKMSSQTKIEKSGQAFLQTVFTWTAVANLDTLDNGKGLLQLWSLISYAKRITPSFLSVAFRDFLESSRYYLAFEVYFRQNTGLMHRVRKVFCLSHWAFSIAELSEASRAAVVRYSVLGDLKNLLPTLRAVIANKKGVERF